MDGLSLRAVITELQCLVGGKIDKVQQPEKDVLLLTVRNGGETKRLLLSSNAETGRVHLTERQYDNPAEPPAFCMLLRRRIVGARIESIFQRGLDRVMEIVISSRDELGDICALRLVIELMGKYSNIIAVSADNIILDCIRHVGPGMSSVRLLLPGQSFIDSPQQGKKDPLALQDEEIIEAFRLSERPPISVIMQFEGISKVSASALAGYQDFSVDTLLYQLSEMRQGLFAPQVVMDGDGNPLQVLPFLPDPRTGLAVVSCGTMSAAYELYYRSRETAMLIRRHAASLKSIVEAELKRSTARYVSYQEALQGGEKAEENKLFGELITANIYRMKRGQRVLIADNYYADPPAEVTIPLDPLKTPQENAQQYYKKYRKAQSAKEHAEREMTATVEEMNYLQGTLDDLLKCDQDAELNEIREELIREGYLHKEQKGIKRRYAPSKPMCFLSPNGSTEIFVGKNNRQNDALTLGASGDQMWLHVKNAPGSHVIIAAAGTPDEETLYCAAMLAAFYSSESSSANVPVDYTPRRFVKKPSGAKGGMVIYTTNRTLYVTPDAAYIRQLTRKDQQK